MSGVFAVVAGWYVLASASTYLLYALDKQSARNRRRRISERRLHCWALAGGWPGALLAQRRLRHKTVKPSFRLRYRLSIGANLALLVGLAMLWQRWH